MKDLSSHVMDIVQNSVRAEAGKIEIEIEEDLKKDFLTITIRDNGSGMDAETLKKVRDPFFTSRTVRKVGLGIPLLQQNAERTGGYVAIESQKGKGTEIKAVFVHAHLDRPPLGNISNTVVLLIVANPSIHFIYTHRTPKGEYRFDSVEVKEVLGDVPLNDPDIVHALEEMIQENLHELEAGREKRDFPTEEDTRPQTRYEKTKE